MKAPGARGKPDLPGGGIPIDDHFGAIVEFDFKDTVAAVLAFTIDFGSFDGRDDMLEHRVGAVEVLGLVHTRAKITFFKDNSRSCDELRH